MRAGYRVGQFLRRATLRRLDTSSAQRILSADAYRLFRSMPLGDQEHGLCVLRRLQEAGEAEDALLQAALLHDVGKAGGGLTLFHRTIVVLLGWCGGGLLERLASPVPRSRRHPFHVHLHHAESGAQRCAAAGCAPEVVALVRHHESGGRGHEGVFSRWLAALANADDRC